MYILSLETSTKNFSLALSKDQKILRSKNVLTEKILESSMIKSIDQLMRSCDLSLSKIDLIAVGLGPGSFTSLRVGLSTVKAFALALNKKIIGIGSLDLIASSVLGGDADEICVIVDARREKIYAALYDRDLKLKTEYLLTSVDDLLTKVHGKTLFVGDGLGLYKTQIEKAYQNFAKNKKANCHALFADEKFWFPQAKELAKLAFDRFDPTKEIKPEAIVPIYLYPQDCQVDRK